MALQHRLLLAFFAAAIAATTAHEAQARSFRVNDLPNGSKYKCLDCHTSNSGHNNTGFGNDAQADLTGSGSKSSKHVDWAALCPVDSDGDGYTNGQELGDPNCTWVRGMANPPGPTSNPGLASSVPAPSAGCGNNVRDAGEDCDGSDLGGATCASIGDGEGTLACSQDCTLDVSQCSTPGNETGSGGGGGSFGDGTTKKTGKNNPPPILPVGCAVSASSNGSDAALLALPLLGLAWARRRRRH